MGVTNQILLLVALTFEGTLAVTLTVRRAYWEFPFFFTYSLYTVLATAAKLLVSSHYRTYFFVFWTNEAVLSVFAVLALHEVFRHIFFGFYRQLRWFGLLFPGVLAVAIGAVIWDAHRTPPVQANAFVRSILTLGIMVNFIQVGLLGLIAAVARSFRLKWRLAPLGITLGFAFSAFGALGFYWARSEFGTNFEIWGKYLPPMANMVAIVVWLDTFLRPEPGPKALSAANMEQLAEAIRQDTMMLKKIVEKFK